MAIDLAGTRLGDFEIVRQLGRGGMGVVYEAVQTSLGRRVALKVLGVGMGLTPKAVDRFRREAAAAARLHHTNIVPVYATGEDRGVHFYAMELIDGPALDAVIRQMRGIKDDGDIATVTPEHLALTGAYVPTSSSPSPSGSGTATGSSSDRFDRAAAMIADVADALHHAHQQGVTHRDIKPSNLLLSSDGRLSITDFGLARMLEQPGMTVTGEFVGTPAYMSPEQIAAGRIPIDHRTDVYSLGATLYELLILRPPFSAEGRDKLLAMVIQKEPRPPRALDPKVPRDLETICLKCLEKDPDQRYLTARDLATDLRRYVNRFAILARRAGPLTRAKKWVKRNPAVAMAALAVLMATGAAGFFAWRANDAEQMRLVAEQTRAEEAAADKRRAAIERAMTAALGTDLVAAEKAVAEAEILGASAGETRLVRGFIAIYNGRSDEAVGHLEQAVRLMPESVAARGLLARTSMSMGDWQAGTRLLDEARAMPLRTPEDRMFLGSALGGIFAADGLALMDQALAERPSVIGHVLRAELRGNVAHFSGLCSDAEAGVADAEVAKRLLPDNPFSIHLAAYAQLTAAASYRLAGRAAEAEEHLAAAGREADALGRFPGNHMAISTRHYVAIARDGLAGKLDNLEEIRKLRLVAPGSGTVFHEAYDLFCRGLDGEAGRLADLHPTERLPGHIRFLVAINKPNGRDEARAAWRAISGPDRQAMYRLEAIPLQFLVDGPKEVSRTVQELRVAGEPLRYQLMGPEDLSVQLAFLEGTATEADLYRRALSNQLSKSRWHVMVAWKRLGGGDRAGTRAAFQQAYDLLTYGSLAWSLARAVLIRMNRDPEWPRAIPMKKG